MTVLELVELPWPGAFRVFTSLEGETPAGSIKDHMVAGELRAWLASGKLRPGQCVAEVSAGSTARSLAHHCRELGLRCALFLPEGTAAAKLAELRDLGAEVLTGPADARLYAALDDHCQATGAIAFDQLWDTSKRRHYESLGRAITERVGRIDAVFGAIGTGHSLLGIAAGIKPRPQVISVEPLDGTIDGVRNLDAMHFGARDPLTADSFDERVLVPVGNIAHALEIDSAAGRLHTTASFQLVLAGARHHLTRTEPAQIFLVGAANRR